MNIRSLLPSDKVVSCLSIPHSKLKFHIDLMTSADFHLAWVDTAFINNTNFFSFLWTANDSSGLPIRTARPPIYLIFYDLNPAQLESIYDQFICNKWTMELIETYTRYKSPVLLKKRRQKVKHQHSKNLFGEIQYFCQLKFSPNNAPNQLKHSIIDKKFNHDYQKIIGIVKGNFFVPVRHTLVSMNQNVISNEHFYHSVLFKPVDLEKKSCYEKNNFFDENDLIIVDNVYQIRQNLSDQDLIQVYDEMTSSSWKMIDLKTYKDKKSDVKFSTIWTRLENFREGTSLLYVGINQEELDQISEKLRQKCLYPKLVVNYGYTNIKNQHVYVVYFTQE